MNSRLRQIADLDRVIHEPARLMIAAILYLVNEADFLYLQSETDLTKGNLSSHLAKLEEAGYVEIEKTYRGKIPMTVCRLTKKVVHRSVPTELHCEERCFKARAFFARTPSATLRSLWGWRGERRCRDRCRENPLVLIVIRAVRTDPRNE
ncbi:MAG: transcriptional regulator [Steroidobacteraceae bacterium]